MGRYFRMGPCVYMGCYNRERILHELISSTTVTVQAIIHCTVAIMGFLQQGMQAR